MTGTTEQSYQSFDQLLEDGWSRPLQSTQNLAESHAAIFEDVGADQSAQNLYNEEELNVILQGLRALDKKTSGFDKNNGYTLAKTIRSALDLKSNLEEPLNSLVPGIIKQAQKGNVNLRPDEERKVLQSIQHAIFPHKGPLWPHEQFVQPVVAPEPLN